MASRGLSVPSGERQRRGQAGVGSAGKGRGSQRLGSGIKVPSGSQQGGGIYAPGWPGINVAHVKESLEHSHVLLCPTEVSAANMGAE